MKRGFTIVELMVVVAVIAVLMTIVTTASINAIHSSREQRKEAMRVALQASIATYQASNDKGDWPGALKNAAENGRTVVLSEEEAQNVFRIIVQKSTGESGAPLPLIDPHALFVAPQGAQAGRSLGMSYDAARHGDEHSRRRLSVAQMLFGYEGRSSGRFHPFNIVYHAETDSVTVHDCCDRCLTINGCRDAKCPHCRHQEER